LADTQDLWNKHANNEIDIIKICSDETGIDVISTITAEEIGASGTKV
jgi:transaldolase